jgi:hypothetical protein
MIISERRSATIEGVNIDHISEGRIVAHWAAANTLERLVSIDALPGLRMSRMQRCPGPPPWQAISEGAG